MRLTIVFSSNSGSSWQILTSRSSEVGWGSMVQKYGGLFCMQQVLLGPHPSPSQRGSSGYVSSCLILGPFTATVTEVVVAYKWRHSMRCTRIRVNARTSKVVDRLCFRTCHRKSPNVLPWSFHTMSKRDSINIRTIQLNPKGAGNKGIRYPFLVGNDLSTQSWIGNAISQNIAESVAELSMVDREHPLTGSVMRIQFGGHCSSGLLILRWAILVHSPGTSHGHGAITLSVKNTLTWFDMPLLSYSFQLLSWGAWFSCNCWKLLRTLPTKATGNSSTQ